MSPHVVIDDPLNQGNNVGKSAFRYPNIKVSNINSPVTNVDVANLWTVIPLSIHRLLLLMPFEITLRQLTLLAEHFPDTSFATRWTELSSTPVLPNVPTTSKQSYA